MNAEDALKEKAKIFHESITWWKKEMASLLEEAESWEEREDHPEYEERMSEYEAKMNYLMLKGEWENTQLEKLQDEITKFEVNKAFNKNKDNEKDF